jgi:dihydroxy-acid dehydratase
VGHVSPEAAEGGDLALVRDGERITVDVDRRTLELDVPEAELARRRAAFQRPRREIASPWLRRYAALVTNASTGAVLRTDL